MKHFSILGHSLFLNNSAPFKASVQKRWLQGQGTHLCLSCLFEGNYCFWQRQETFKLCCADRKANNVVCCAMKLAKCVAGVWHTFVLQMLMSVGRMLMCVHYGRPARTLSAALSVCAKMALWGGCSRTPCNVEVWSQTKLMIYCDFEHLNIQ